MECYELINYNNFNYNNIYLSNNCGYFIILAHVINTKNANALVKIKFLLTNYCKIVSYRTAMLGQVKDPYYPSIYGVACIGLASSRSEGYNIWHNIIRRCYNPNCSSYKNYGAIGVKVCDRWLCFENFLNDLIYIDGYLLWKNNPGLYQLDKDLKQQNIPSCDKIYSLETCCFITFYDNARLVNKPNQKSIYTGVYPIENNKYEVAIGSSGTVEYKHLGTYMNEEAAANIYNAYAFDYNIKNNMAKFKINDAPYMSPLEIKQSASKRCKFPGVPLYHLVNK